MIDKIINIYNFIINVFHYLICFVVKLFVYIYSFLGDILVEFYNFTFKYLYILDSDIRRDIFIGVTGLTIAIIIFIAEVISNKKYELEKKLILKKTGIKKNILFCIIIFFMMFLSLIFKSSYHKEVIEYYITCDIVYYLIQLVLNFLVIVYMVLAVRIFWIAVKLNTDSDYFGEELDKFLNKKTIDIEKNAYKQNIKGFKKLKREFDSFIKSNIHITNDSLSVAFSSELYSPIYPSRNGILKKYDYRTISTLLDALQLSKLDETNEYIDKEEIIIAFTKNIGDKINKNTPIAYCLKKYFKHFKELSNCIIIDSNSSYIGDEIRIINENFLEYSLNFKKPSNFDENDRLFNYFNHLYKNDLSGVKSIALEQLEVIARHLYMDDYKNRKFANFLNRLLSLSFSNDNYDDYSRINRLIGILYLERLKIENANVKEIAYNFSVHYFHVNYFSVKKYDELCFYDNLMSIFLIFICELIKKKEFESINIIFNNILLDNSDYSDGDLDEKEIINFQLVCGLICCIKLVNFDENENKSINNIINWIRRNLFNLYDAWNVIKNFKQYYKKESSVQNVYNNFTFDFGNHEYQSIWTGFNIDDNELLRDIIIAFNIEFIVKEEINLNDIKKDDAYFYKRMISLFEDNNKSKFEFITNKEFNKTYIIEALNLAISESNKKEEEYNKTHELVAEKVTKFENDIKSSILKEEPLIELLQVNKKIKTNDLSLKKVFGINQLIPRNLFFEDCYGLENVAKDYGNLFGKGIRESIIKKINTFSDIYDEDVNTVINNLEDVENYILITNFTGIRKISNYDRTTNFVNINNKQLQVLKIPKIDSYYLILKKDLPILEFCQFDSIYPLEEIESNVFYSFEDCSKDEELRNEIIKNSSWLSEKGDLETQNTYLKTQCRLRVYLSFRIKKVKNSKAIRIKLKKET